MADENGLRPKEAALPRDVIICRSPARGHWQFHPYLTAVIPVATLYASNADETPFRDVLLPLLALLGCAAVAASLARVVYRSSHRAALAATWFLALSFIYRAAQYALDEFLNKCGLPDVRHEVLLIAWGAVVAGGLVWAGRGRFDDFKATSLANTVSAVMAAVAIGSALMRAHATARPAPVRLSDGEEQAGEMVHLQRPAETRDVYYFIFDRYTDHATLRDDYDYDNTPFYDSLRGRGFFVATEARSNYPKTVFAMSSALNMEYHEQAMNYRHSLEGLKNHRVGRLLRSQGYEYHHLGNWYGPLTANENADFNYNFSALPSEFANVLYEMTPFAKVLPVRASCRDTLKQFEAVEKIASRHGPKFVYAHFMLPHPPFRFDRDGSSLSWRTKVSRSHRENYVNQLVFANRRMLEMIDVVLAESETVPIIVLQADEGDWLEDVPADRSRAARLRRRTGILSAFLLPGTDCHKEIPSTMSPVNTFRLIFKTYFGAKIGLLEDRAFYWERASADGTPAGMKDNRFVDVTEEVRGTSVK